jgi:hypothetical protein
MRGLGTLTLSLLLATGLVACGDDGDGGGDALELEEVEGAGDNDDDEGDDESDETTTTEGEESDDEGDDGGDVDFGDLASEDCDFLFEALTSFGTAFTGEGDIDFQQIADAYSDFADVAPDDIADDVRTVADAFDEFAGAVGDIDLSDPNAFSDPEVAQRIADASQAFNTPEFNDANTAVTEFLATECTPGVG